MAETILLIINYSLFRKKEILWPLKRVVDTNYLFDSIWFYLFYLFYLFFSFQVKLNWDHRKVCIFTISSSIVLHLFIYFSSDFLPFCLLFVLNSVSVLSQLQNSLTLIQIAQTMPNDQLKQYVEQIIIESTHFLDKTFIIKKT